MKEYERIPESFMFKAGDGSYHMRQHILRAHHAEVNGWAHVKVAEEPEGHIVANRSKGFGDRGSGLCIPPLPLSVQPSLCLSLICSVGLVIGGTSKAGP